MIERSLAPVLRRRAAQFPVVTLIGPRQSGKTTLCRAEFSAKPYVSLETPDVRAFAIADPRGFLAQFPEGAVIDEIQRVPPLLSYLQTDVDSQRQMGRWVLTGSQNLGLVESVTQSLAGRTSVDRLLPLALGEVPPCQRPESLWDLLVTGGYPAIFDRNVPAGDWLGAYVDTYVERDVRGVLGVRDLLSFQSFLRLAAGRTSQLINIAQLGADAGITQPTARAWLGVLEATFVSVMLAPWHQNLVKRETQSPKLLFLDAGLVCALLGIRSGKELASHPLRGAIFETWVGSECVKAATNGGRRPRVFHYRDRRGLEVDLIVERAADVLAIEAKSGATVASDWFEPIKRFAALAEAAGRTVAPTIVYGGDASQRRSGADVVGYRNLPERVADREDRPSAA